jgi:diguanylate cyclase (GGDEF)-like protein
MGVLTLANRQSEVTGFHNEDLRVAGTLANHISVALENGRLEVSLEQLRVLERRMHHQAHHDALTGLANRSLFHALVTEALAEDEVGQVAALFIDLDDFKTVNDTLGHAAGDDLLVAVSQRLDACLGPDDAAARLGGDEFAILVRTSSPSSQRAREVAGAVLEVLNEPVDVDGHHLPVYASIGVAVSDAQTDVAALLRNADTAMYTAKARGKRCVEVFDAEMRAAVLSRYSVTYEIERAIAEHELVAYFQPLINLADHTVIGAETLVRWQHPTRGLLPPDQFIAIAEQSDAIFQVDKYMLELACGWLAEWNRTNRDDVQLVTVNLTARDLRQPELPALVRTTLERHRLHPSSLVLEVTESLAMQDQQAAIEMMSQLKDIGVLIALDDFGTGYSSLSQLRDLPVDIVKMARPFVDNLTDTPGQAAFAEAIVTLAQILGKTVIAEGIEGPEQLDILARLGCDIGQGYHFAQPMDASSFRTWFGHWRTARFRHPAARASNVIALPA